MISPETKVSWIDIRTGEEKTDDVRQLFQQYSDRAQIVNANIFTIPFEPGTVIVKDWYGWTELQFITVLQEAHQYPWYKVTVGDKHVIMNGGAFIPIYKPDPDHITIGFHGQQKHPYILTQVARIPKEDAWARVRYGREDSDFMEVRDEFLVPNDSPNLCYELKTKSKFINANDIYIYASDEIDIEEVLKWN